ncbi:MAG: hypothetical protein NVS2B8_13620 [Vulcanimicrobiaceae bacterium]
MTDARTLVTALNALAKKPQFSNSKALATARKDPKVDWTHTRVRNDDFNPDVDGCQSFVMLDGSVAVWSPTSGTYVAKSG